MNVKLLKRLRKEAYKQIKIRYNINDTYSIINAYYDRRYMFSIDMCSLTEAKQKLIIARRLFIRRQVDALRSIKLERFAKEVTKELNKY